MGWQLAPDSAANEKASLVGEAFGADFVASLVLASGLFLPKRLWLLDHKERNKGDNNQARASGHRFSHVNSW
jgi:hypothetical protein